MLFAQELIEVNTPYGKAFAFLQNNVIHKKPLSFLILNS